MKYTVSGSTLQYKVGLTLSFLSLFSRGVGGNQKGNTSIKVDLPPPVHFSICTTRFPYKTYGGKPHTICMGEARNRGASILSRIYRPTM